MKISMAHLRERSTTGGWINFAVFEAKSTSGDNPGLLQHLTMRARASGLKIEQSALAYVAGGRVRFFGDKNLVSYLSSHGVPNWTHRIDL